MKANALFDLTGHVVVVTGAASGIGLATSQVVAANGARVVMIDVDGDRLVGASNSVRPADPASASRTACSKRLPLSSGTTACASISMAHFTPCKPRRST